MSIMAKTILHSLFLIGQLYLCANGFLFGSGGCPGGCPTNVNQPSPPSQLIYQPPPPQIQNSYPQPSVPYSGPAQNAAVPNSTDSPISPATPNTPILEKSPTKEYRSAPYPPHYLLEQKGYPVAPQYPILPPFAIPPKGYPVPLTYPVLPPYAIPPKGYPTAPSHPLPPPYVISPKGYPVMPPYVVPAKGYPVPHFLPIPHFYPVIPVFVPPPPTYPTPPPTYATPPPPQCFKNKDGYKCCSKELDEYLTKKITELLSPKWKKCNMQKFATDMQIDAQERFNHSMESVIASEKIENRSSYPGTLYCKKNGPDGKTILVYGSPIPYILDYAHTRPMTPEEIKAQNYPDEYNKINYYTGNDEDLQS